MDDDRPAPDLPPASVSATVASVLALVAGFVVAAGLVLLASLLSLCGLFGEECTPHERSQIGWALVGGVTVFFAVPGLVAVVRRDARWLLAPLVELGLLAVGVAVWGLS